VTIDQVKEHVVFHCDTCPDSLDTGVSTFDEAILKLRGAGWAFYKELGEEQWKHRCLECFKSGRMRT